MASNGDFLINNNATDRQILPNGGASVVMTYSNNLKSTNSDAMSIAANGVFTLTTGKYFITYSDKFSTSDTANNQRFQINGRILRSTPVGSTRLAYSGDFIRKQSGQQQAFLTGQTIVNVTESTEDFNVEYRRTDSSTTGTCERVPGEGSLQIIRLDDSNSTPYISVNSTLPAATPNGTQVTYPQFETETVYSGPVAFEVDPFAPGVVACMPGTYIVSYSADITTTQTGREDVVGKLNYLDVSAPNFSAAVVEGSYSYGYLRGGDGCLQTALSNTCIIEVADNGQTGGVVFSFNVPTSAIVSADDVRIQLYRIPDNTELIQINSTSGSLNLNNNFQFQTVARTSSKYSATNNSSIITADAGFHFGIANFSKQIGTLGPQRGYPLQRFSVNNIIDTTSGDAAYNRNSGDSARIATSTIGIIEANSPGTQISVSSQATAAPGVIDIGDSSIVFISLDDLFGDYALPPSISEINSGVVPSWSDTTWAIDGFNFSETVGTVEIWSDLVGTVSVSQSIVSWSDTQIVINTTRGSLLDNTNLYLQVSNQAGAAVFKFPIGNAPYANVIEDMGPDHLWMFDGDYNESINSLNASARVGSPIFANLPLSRGASSSVSLTTNGDRFGPSNSPFMNEVQLETRTMGGWIRLSKTQDSFTVLYEEGGGINNIAFFIGVGGVLVAQLADTGDDNVHAYSDFRLVPDRNYHILFRFDYNGTSVFELLVDGVVQQSTFGNPLLATNLDAHSGDITWGKTGNLEVFGTDVLFAGTVIAYYQAWTTFTSYVTDEEAKTQLFELGAVEDISITEDTEANMQIEFSKNNNTVYGNSAMTFKIEECSEGDFTLNAEGITIDDSTSIGLQYAGTNTLTLVNLSGSNFSSDKISTPYGGIVILQRPSLLTLTNLEEGSKVTVYESGTLTLLGGKDNLNGEYKISVNSNSVDISVTSLGFLNFRITNVDSTSDKLIPINQRVDRQYKNN